jgi:hypothetical protein
MPQLNYLRSLYPTDQLEMIGVPIDPNDSATILDEYVAQHHPPYTMLGNLTLDEIQRFTQTLAESSAHKTPATILTDSRGTILKVMPGVPTVSDISKALRQNE